MLVLSFRPGEKAIFELPNGEECIVQVVEARRGGKVRMGFQFPEDIRILRESVALRDSELQPVTEETAG